MQGDNHTHMLIGRDFNAQVGANEEPDAIDCKCVGEHPNGMQNSRGLVLTTAILCVDGPHRCRRELNPAVRLFEF